MLNDMLMIQPKLPRSFVWRGS